MGLDCLALCVEPEDLSAAGGRADQSQQQPDRGGLPRTIGAKVAQDFAWRHLKIEIVDGVELAVALGQSLGANGWFNTNAWVYRFATDAESTFAVRARRMSAIVNPISSMKYGLIDGRGERWVVPLVRRGDTWCMERLL